MPAIIGTVFLTALAVLAYKIWISSWLIFDVEPSRHPAPAPIPISDPSHVVSPVVTVDLRGVAEIINASQQHLPVIVLGIVAVAVPAIFCWAVVSVVKATTPRNYSEIPNSSRPREISKGNLPVVREDNPFEKWR